MGRDVHVVKRDNGWAALLEGNDRASALASTQAEAIEAGKRLAQRERSELVIHRPNGQIRDKRSFGNDPYPPKG